MPLDPSVEWVSCNNDDDDDDDNNNNNNKWPEIYPVKVKKGYNKEHHKIYTNFRNYKSVAYSF